MNLVRFPAGKNLIGQVLLLDKKACIVGILIDPPKLPIKKVILLSTPANSTLADHCPPPLLIIYIFFHCFFGYATQHVGFSPTRDQTHVPCIGSAQS